MNNSGPGRPSTYREELGDHVAAHVAVRVVAHGEGPGDRPAVAGVEVQTCHPLAFAMSCAGDG